MTRKHLAASLAFVIIGGWLISVMPSVHAQSADDLFNPETLQELRLFINSKDLATLKARIEDNSFFPADLVWRNTRVRNVAVRNRGYGSRTPNKLGLLLDFDEYTTKQQFIGLKSLVLKNLWQDPAMIREKVALGLYERMGQPASRESFGRVYINNVYQGVFAIVENIDPTFLTRAYGENGGYLFEYHYRFKWDSGYLGDSLDLYKPLFEARTHERESDTEIYSPLRDLFREVSAPIDGVWRQRVEQFVDLKQYLTLVAIEVFLVEWDGLTGDWGTANFYVYRPAGSTLHRLITWDRDHAMWEDFRSSIFLRTDQNVVFRQAMQIPELYNHYLDELQRCAERALADDWLRMEIDKRASVIRDAVYEDPNKQFPNDQFDNQILVLNEFVAQRPQYVLNEVTKARSAVR